MFLFQMTDGEVAIQTIRSLVPPAQDHHAALRPAKRTFLILGTLSHSTHH